MTQETNQDLAGKIRFSQSLYTLSESAYYFSSQPPVLHSLTKYLGDVEHVEQGNDNKKNNTLCVCYIFFPYYLIFYYIILYNL